MQQQVQAQIIMLARNRWNGATTQLLYQTSNIGQQTTALTQIKIIYKGT
jgi:hypothetical protein